MEPVKYQLDKLEDILKIPEASADRFFEDIRRFYDTMKPVRNLMDMVNPTTPIVEKFVWIDDGVRGGSGDKINIRVEQR